LQAEVTIETVPVGNPNNAADSTGYGAVNYEYNIGKYEVTNAQYCAFLNSVAASDPYQLYATDMAGGYGGIVQSGLQGGYTYSPRGSLADRPVNHVNWGDAARFANWLHNGQPTGTLTGDPTQDAGLTENGAYYLNGATSNAALLAVSRKVDDWKWAVTSEDEWYKAAYYDGDTGAYYDYPTRSNTPPAAEATPGADLVNGSANYGSWAGVNRTVTIAGAYDAKPSDSPYGTFDQGGNVAEWNEAIVTTVLHGSRRNTRGGGMSNGSNLLSAMFRDPQYQTSEHYDVGFRVVQTPEPATVSIMALSGLALLRRRKT
jgi:formylglycine-generating enzyme